MEVETTRGGFRKPISTREFILNYLERQEDYIANMHRAYKAELDRLARENNRKRTYHKPRYHSFEMSVQQLARDGLIEFSGREEESDSPQFQMWPLKPIRRYYRLKTLPRLKELTAEEKAGEISPIQALFDKWKNRGKNIRLLKQDMQTIDPEVYDLTAIEDAIYDYEGIDREDYETAEEYQEARNDSWDNIIDDLDSLID